MTLTTGARSLSFKKAAIIGVGLIGGSLARVLKSRGLAGEIHGAGRSRQSLERALRLGVIDRMSEIFAAVENADLVVLAMPVGSFESVLSGIASKLKAGAIVTDVGSVKSGPVRLMETILPPGVRSVGGHPIAGREQSGVEASVETLFQGARCILTPTAATDPGALDVVKQLWEAAGSTVTVMAPEKHDHIFAAVSHMPHVAAYAMMASVSELGGDQDPYIAYTGGGFRDFTRIAASSPEMWRDICLANARNVEEMIDRYLFALNRIKKAVHRGDAARLERIFNAASTMRRGMQ